MKEYVFIWTLEPAGKVTDEFNEESGSFVVTVKGDRIEIRAWEPENEKDHLQQQAAARAANLATILSIQYQVEINLGPPIVETYHVEPESVRKDVEVGIIGGRLTMGGTLDYKVLDNTGKLVNSSQMQKEKQRQQSHRRNIQLADRAAVDPVLREMLQYQAKYKTDPLGRLHHLYDLLQVAERVYQGRKGAADALRLSEDDLGELARIANNPNLTNARHPGKSPEHHPASAKETATCERVADALIAARAADTRAAA